MELIRKKLYVVGKKKNMYRIAKITKIFVVFASVLILRYVIIGKDLKASKVENINDFSLDGIQLLPQKRRSLSRLYEVSTEYGSCFDSDINWNDGTQPLYAMNPDLFLIPTLQNGPNNQLIGFQQSILVSLLLNRTLVLPRFYEHSMSDVYYRKMVDPLVRIDVQKLRRFISVIPMEAAKERCNSKFEAVFAPKGLNLIIGRSTVKFVKVHLETGLSGANYKDGILEKHIQSIKSYIFDNAVITDADLLSKPWWPKNRTSFGWMASVLRMNDNPIAAKIYPSGNINESIELDEVRTAYRTNAKCAVYWFPFRTFHLKHSEKDKRKSLQKWDLSSIDSKNGGAIYLDILRHVQPPISISEWANEFREQFLQKNGKGYLALHWRFDEKDFFRYICKDGLRAKFCGEVRNAKNATAISTAILKRLADLKTESEVLANSVYIATPPTLTSFVEEIKTILTNKNTVKNIRKSFGVTNGNLPSVFSAEDIKKFVRQKHRNCRMSEDTQILDTISQIEMHLCVHSSSFLWSRQSTWSSNTKVTRYIDVGVQARKADFSITDYTVKVQQFIHSTKKS